MGVIVYAAGLAVLEFLSYPRIYVPPLKEGESEKKMPSRPPSRVVGLVGNACMGCVGPCAVASSPDDVICRTDLGSESARSAVSRHELLHACQEENRTASLTNGSLLGRQNGSIPNGATSDSTMGVPSHTLCHTAPHPLSVSDLQTAQWLREQGPRTNQGWCIEVQVQPPCALAWLHSVSPSGSPGSHRDPSSAEIGDIANQGNRGKPGRSEWLKSAMAASSEGPSCCFSLVPTSLAQPSFDTTPRGK
jgi:hypothetical protein